MTNTTDTNQTSEDELNKTVERLLRFNCHNGCDGNGSYPEMGSDGEWEQGQCQWCFEYGMPARDAIETIIRTEKQKLLAEVRERVIGEDLPLPEEIMAQTGTRHPGRTYCQAYTSIDLPKSLCYSRDKYVKGANGTSVFGLQRQR